MALENNPHTAIPVIDISSPSPAVAQQVLDAASTHGFLFIKNDGVTIPPKDIADMFELSRQYFQQPESQKSEFAIHSEKAGGMNRGWVKMQGESLDPDGQKKGDPKEAFNIGTPAPNQAFQPLPYPLSASTQLIRRFQTSCHTLCTSLLALLNAALRIPDPAYFTSQHDPSRGPSGTIFRLLYYPASPAHANAPRKEEEQDPDIRAGPHSDYGSLTLLFRLPDQPGLELLQPDGKTWTSVPTNPSPTTLADAPILVNIGDLLAFWTGGLLKSTVHRVAFARGADGRVAERYSMAYFCHPVDDALLGTVPGEVIRGVVASGVGEGELERQRERLGVEGGEERVWTAREHLERRLKVTYGLGD